MWEAIVNPQPALPPQKPTAMLAGGDATKGKTLFATCVACHQADAGGNRCQALPAGLCKLHMPSHHKPPTVRERNAAAKAGGGAPASAESGRIKTAA